MQVNAGIQTVPSYVPLKHEQKCEESDLSVISYFAQEHSIVEDFCQFHELPYFFGIIR